MKEKLSVDIHIENLTQPQKIALEDFLHQWMVLGSVGSSRWTAFYADGDGDFRPRITFDGRKPESSQLAGGPQKRWRQHFEEIEVYAIDFDSIAWELHRR